MQLTYYQAESAVRQPELEVGTTTVYFRRNFQQVERPAQEEGREPELIWTYEECALTKNQAIYKLAEENAVNSDAILELAELIGG